MSSKPFDPSAVFSRKVARKFLIRNRDFCKYTEEQLDEEIPHKLRTFIIEGKVWYLAKDVTSFLGINPNNSSRAVQNLNSKDVRQVDVTLKISDAAQTTQTSQTHPMYFINEAGIYALIQKSRTIHAKEFKDWLISEVLPVLNNKGEYKDHPGCVFEKTREIVICPRDKGGFLYCIRSPFFQPGIFKIGKVRKLKNLDAYKRPYGKVEILHVKAVSNRDGSEIDLKKELKEFFVKGEIVKCPFETIKEKMDNIN